LYSGSTSDYYTSQSHVRVNLPWLAELREVDILIKKTTPVVESRFRLHAAADRMRALVIDDDRSVGAAIQLILARRGFETVLAADPHGGAQAFESSKFDVVIVDIFLSGMSGLEAIADFRRRAAAIPIIAMSGFRFRDSMDPGLDFLGMAAERGATTCLRKPFAPQQLLAAVSSGLEWASSRDRAQGSPEPAQGPSRCL